METQLIESKKRKEIVSYANENNLLIEPKAIDLLEREEDFKKILEEFIEQQKFVIEFQELEQKIVMQKTKIDTFEEEVVIERQSFKPIASQIESNIKELEELNVRESTSTGTVKDFLNFFQDKFNVLEEILRKRQQLNPKPIKRLRAVSQNNELDIIGMVSRKWITKNNNLAFELEDLEASCIVIVSEKNEKLFVEAKKILTENVIGVKGKKIGEGMIVANEILLPELPLRAPKRIEKDLNLVAISDLHVGSKLFLEHSFEKFLAWLKGEIGTRKEIEQAGKVKYIVILGDNVDGVGVYPAQINELSIRDIFEQYQKFTELMKEIPEYIEVSIIPGQHDAVRFSDPQEAISAEFLPELHKMKNFHFLSSPGWIEIEGLKTLLYHGPAMHDLYSSVGHLSYSKPDEAMIELLKRRDIMPCYGMKRPYTPERKDFMVLGEIPDLFFTGDLHHNSHNSYRGTMVFSCGTWQSQTDFQLKQGHVPTPGIATVYNLKTGQIEDKNFYKKELGEGL